MLKLHTDELGERLWIEHLQKVGYKVFKPWLTRPTYTNQQGKTVTYYEEKDCWQEEKPDGV